MLASDWRDDVCRDYSNVSLAASVEQLHVRRFSEHRYSLMFGAHFEP